MFIVIARRCLLTVAGAALVAGLAANTRAQSSENRAVELSLEELLDTVRTVNPALKSARLDWVAEYKRVGEPALPDPAVMFTYLPAPVYTARGSQTWQVRAEQRFPFPGKIRLQKEVATEEAYIVQQHAAELDQQLSFELKQGYHRLIRIVAQENLALGFQLRLREFEEVAVSRYRVGAGSQQAIVKAQLERNRLDNFLLGLDKNRATTEALISRLRGDGDVLRINPKPVIITALPRDFDLDQLVALAIGQRPDVRALDASGRRWEHAEELARKQLYPDVGISVAYIGIDREPIPETADGKDAFAISATLSIPLYRSSKHASMEHAQVRQSSIELKRINAENKIRSQLSDILWRLDRDRDRLTLIRETLIPEAQSTLDLALSGYTTGQLQFLDLLDAERALFSIRNELEVTLEEYAVSTAELEMALGVPSLAHLPSPVTQ